MISININDSTCIRCNKCVRVCPADIFHISEPEKNIIAEKVENCIDCGHCVAVCPTDSVIHSEFPPEKVHPIERALLPSPEQLMMLIKSRRSNRAFSSKNIPEEYIKQILIAATHAPTATNSRNVSFTVITDPEQLRYISNYTINSLESTTKKVKILKPLIKRMAPGLAKTIQKIESRIAKHKTGYDTILRGATTVIFFHTPKQSRFGTADANLAYQNASLMAESLGVAQFYTGYVCSVNDKNKLQETLNIPGKIQAGMALGMPSFTFSKYIDRFSGE